jgi:Skp family chaperone for outer membrane proteins
MFDRKIILLFVLFMSLIFSSSAYAKIAIVSTERVNSVSFLG